MIEQPFLFAVSGVKNSGKTTLITKLIPIFRRYGLRTATIKHDGHDFEADVPGTDTHAHMQAGAYGTAVFSKTKYMVVKQEEAVSECELMKYFPEADIILLEGFKYSNYPKLELVRKGNSETSVCADESVIAVASDFLTDGDTAKMSDRGFGAKQAQKKDIPLLNLNDAEEIAEFILDYRFIQTSLSMAVLAGGKSSRMGRDKSDLPYEGQTFLQRQIEKGKTLGIADIFVSGYRGTQCTERIVKDRYPQKGPLGGLEATFREVKTPYCLVMTVDVPLVTVEVLRELIRAARRAWMSGSTNPVLILKHGERTEPLLGIYRTDLADAIEAELAEGKGRVFQFLEKVGYDVSESLAPEKIFENVNQPEDYEKMKRM